MFVKYREILHYISFCYQIFPCLDKEAFMALACADAFALELWHLPFFGDPPFPASITQNCFPLLYTFTGMVFSLL
jgi:hypothetical protein